MNNKHIQACFFIIVQMYHCEGDLSLKYFRTRLKDIWKDSPKVWHCYIQMFLYRYLKNIDHGYEFSDIYLLKILKYSEIFFTIKNKNIKFNLKHDQRKNELIFEETVSLVSGNIVTKITRTTVPVVNISFYFHLTPKLLANLTFFHFHVYLHQKLCTFKIKTVTRQLDYCGLHSTFCYFPKFNKFALEISSKRLTLFVMNITFSVIDGNVIHDHTPARHTERGFYFDLVNVMSTSYTLRREYILTSFQILLHVLYKVELVIFKKWRDDFVVYDGPRMIFNTLYARYISSTRAVVSASTFTCFIQFLLNFKVENNNEHFTFSGKLVKMVNYTNGAFEPGSYNKLTLPSNECDLGSCSILVSTGSDLIFNFSVIKIVVYSSAFSSTMYQGVRVGEFDNGQPRDLFGQTQKTYAWTVSLRHYYTRSSRMWFYSFWYAPISHISATFSVMTTKCISVRIDLCLYVYSCSQGAIECNRYLTGLTTKARGFSLTAHAHFKQVIQFSIQSGCVVLVANNANRLYPKVKFNPFLRICKALLIGTPGRFKIDYATVVLNDEDHRLQHLGLSSSLVCSKGHNGINMVNKNNSAYLSYYQHSKRGWYLLYPETKSREGCLYKEFHALKMELAWKATQKTFYEILISHNKDQDVQYEYLLPTHFNLPISFKRESFLPINELAPAGMDMLLTLQNGF